MTVRELLRPYPSSSNYSVFIFDTENNAQLKTDTFEMKRDDGLRIKWKNANVVMWNVCDNEIVIAVDSKTLKESVTKEILIADTNTMLSIDFYGDFTESEMGNALTIIAREILHQTIYYNNLAEYYWMYGYKSKCGYWVKKIELSNSWKNIKCEVEK